MTDTKKRPAQTINEQVLTLSDLRTIGKQGGATARLDTGEDVELLADFAAIYRHGYVEGKLQRVKVVLNYPNIYSKIRTIKRDDVLIARRTKGEKKTELLLTGKGYHRPEKLGGNTK
ncbi:MAG: hypothetical protein LBI43_06840 [Streptococcaceae bacterium]|jgi:hypothetical protein|nr:hypothetical protein [Streptococcaceae bacterium]